MVHRPDLEVLPYPGRYLPAVISTASPCFPSNRNRGHARSARKPGHCKFERYPVTERSIKSYNGQLDLSKQKLKIRSAKNLKLRKEIQQSHVIIGRNTLGYKNKSRLKVNLISHILGEGSSSRLFHTLREKNGITYQINTYLNSFSSI